MVIDYQENNFRESVQVYMVGWWVVAKVIFWKSKGEEMLDRKMERLSLRKKKWWKTF